MLRPCLLSLLLVAVAASHLLSNEAQPDEAQPKVSMERITIPLSNQPATDVATTLNETFAGEPDVRVISSVSSNIVIIEAPPSKASKILDLVREIDHPLPMITIEAMAVEIETGNGKTTLQNGPTKDVQRAVADLQQQQQLRVVDRLRFTALSNQEAFIQVGQRTPSQTSRQTTRGGGMVSNYEYHDVGVLLRCIARAARDGSIAMDVSYEKSTLVPSKPADADNPTPMTVVTTKLQSTVRLAPNESVVFGGLREDTATDENVEWRLILSAQAK